MDFDVAIIDGIFDWYGDALFLKSKLFKISRLVKFGKISHWFVVEEDVAFEIGF